LPGVFALIVSAFITTLTITSCGQKSTTIANMDVPGGNPDRGAADIQTYACGRCHVIDGIQDANGKVGPPLTDIVERSFIAGEVANTPDNMIRWIQNPQAIEPNTAMPNLGVSEHAARDIAAYLYTRQ
jgi:cytochrome c2